MDDLFPFPADADAPQIPPDLSLPMYGRSTSLFQGLLAKILPSSPGKIRDQLSICVQCPLDNIIYFAVVGANTCFVYHLERI